MHTVPVIDMHDPGVRDGSPAALEALDAACRDHGFFLLVNHGLEDAIEDMWASARTFFDSPRDVRLSILRTDSKPLGYYDRELTKRKRDLKEVFIERHEENLASAGMMRKAAFSHVETFHDPAKRTSGSRNSSILKVDLA